MKRNKQYLQLIIITKIFFCFLFMFGCEIKSKDNTTLRYTDFDLSSHRGINKIDESVFSDYNSSKKPYIEISYKNGIIDSITVFNISSTPYYIKSFARKEIFLYEVNKFNELYGSRRSFVLIDKGEIYQYSFITPVVYPDGSMDCQIHRMSNNKSYSINCQIKQADTVDFINKLLNEKHIELWHIFDTSATKNINKEEQTLINYLEITSSKALGS